MLTKLSQIVLRASKELLLLLSLSERSRVRQLWALNELDDELLADIGINPSQRSKTRWWNGSQSRAG